MPLPDDIQDLESRARLENRIAVGTMIVGGAVVATGIALVVLNRPRRVLRETAPQPAEARIIPVISSDQLGVGLQIHF
jgi:hypothetical protein